MTIPTADFIGTPLIGFDPLVAFFTNLSAGTPTSFLWNFGDPASGGDNTSVLENPSHIYTTTGDFTVSLTASNISGDSTETKIEYINVLSAPDLLADFITTSVGTAVGGVRVDFSDQSITATFGTTYFWEFGDGDTSTEQNPSHTYADPGAFQVVLTINVGPFTSEICKNVVATLQIPRFMEIWGTVSLIGGVPIEADKLVTVALNDGSLCEETHTGTFRTYRTVDDAGTVRFIVRARGDAVGIDNSGFADGELVRLFFGGRLATDSNGDPIEIPFFQTLPSTPQSHIELDIVLPLPVTTATPVGGTFSNRVAVTLLSNVVPSTIFYTLDGSDPTISGTRIEFTVPFEIIEGTTEVKFFTEDPLGPDEGVKTEVYIVEDPAVIPSLPVGDYSSNQEIILIGNRPGVINMSINGGPFEIYDGLPILIEAGPSGFGTVVIQAFLNDTINSVIGSTSTLTYNLDLVRPVITSFTINNGDDETTTQLITVQVDASSFTNSITGLVLSEVPDFTGATVQLYASEVTFTLSPGDGPKELYAQVTDQLEQFSVIKMTSIEMNTETPTITVSAGPGAPIGDTSFTFTGTKSAESGVLVQITVNGNIGDEVLVIPIDSTVEWSYSVSLSEGTNEIKFQTITAAQNRSIEEIRTAEVTLIPEGITTGTTITSAEGLWRIPFVFFEEKANSHVFAILVEASFGADPIVLFPEDEATINEKIITVSGTADPGSTITLRVVEA